MFFHRITDQTYAARIAPSLLILSSFCWHSLRMVPFNRLIFSALVAITLLPLSLHMIAWDTSRIWTYPIIVAMLALWGISEIFPAAVTKKRDSLFFCLIAMMVVVLQLFIVTPLMDGMQERYSTEERIFLYAPSLIVIAMFTSKYYSLIRHST